MAPRHQPAHATTQIVTADAAAPAPAPAPAPGKTTRTQRLSPSATPTGIPLVDAGTVCDRQPDEADCLDPQRRLYSITALARTSGTAMANYGDAIQDKRIELLTEKEAGPGFLVEFLIELGTGPLVGLAIKGARSYLLKAAASLFEHDQDRLALAIARFATNEARLKEVIGVVAKKGATQLKGILSTKGQKHKAETLKLLRDGISAFANDLILIGVTRLSDLEITALALGYADQELHSVSSYAAQVDAWLARYDANGLENVGEVDAGTRRKGISVEADEFVEYNVAKGELAWVTLHTGEFRLALLTGEVGRETFQRLIDRDFENLAIATYTVRRGHPPQRQYTLSRQEQDQACTWADRAWVNGIVGCQPEGTP